MRSLILSNVSDFYGTYASGLRQPLIVRVTGEEEFVQATGVTNPQYHCPISQRFAIVHPDLCATCFS